MAETRYHTTPPAVSTMPPGIPYIVGNEAAERFSFYGMKAILTVFMTRHLLDATGQAADMGEEEAKAWVHNFVTAAYFFPILGAVLSDWLFGKYRTILALSLVYCAGHAVLALMDVRLPGMPDPQATLFWGLALIAVGSGGIKPCVSAHVGDQFGKQNQHLLPRVFGWFYFAINLGSTVSMLLTPLLLKRFGPGVAFGVPGILMGVATVVFWMGRKVFVHIPPARDQFFSETFSPDGRRAIRNLIPLYFFVAMFWSLFDQTASAWVLQAEHMNRNVFGIELLSSQLQAINPILVMLFIPLFSYVLYPLAGRFVQVTPLRRIGAGMFLTVPAFAVPALIEHRIAAGEAPHITWQILAYVLMTGAEILVSITSLEFSYTQAPRKMKSFIMGLYLLAVAAGNQFTAQVNHRLDIAKKEAAAQADKLGSAYQPPAWLEMLEGPGYYWFFTAAMAVFAVLFVVYAQFYKGETFIQDDQAE